MDVQNGFSEWSLKGRLSMSRQPEGFMIRISRLSDKSCPVSAALHMNRMRGVRDLVFHSIIEIRFAKSVSQVPVGPEETSLENTGCEVVWWTGSKEFLAKHKSREEQKKLKEIVETGQTKHLASEEIEKMMEGSENVINDSLPPRNDEP
ncbi:hypothetical protein Tco_1562193 [Tanacetum coccineum]